MPSILTAPIYTDVRQYSGDPQTPPSLQKLRRNTLRTMQRFGTPVLLKRMYTAEDADNGVAVVSPTRDSVYGQSTHVTDDLSYGVGYVSAETQDGEWYDPATGELYISDDQPDETFLPAPRYRGYGPGFLTYAILPDRPEDTWKLTPQGALTRQQQAMVQLPWWPQVGDNDLLITCQLEPNGLIAETFERYQLKMVTPITMRGSDRLGEREFVVNAGGNRYWIGQQAEMTKIPTHDIVYQLETDR